MDMKVASSLHLWNFNFVKLKIGLRPRTIFGRSVDVTINEGSKKAPLKKNHPHRAAQTKFAALILQKQRRSARLVRPPLTGLCACMYAEKY